jgi:hypothetical protein
MKHRLRRFVQCVLQRRSLLQSTVRVKPITCSCIQCEHLGRTTAYEHKLYGFEQPVVARIRIQYDRSLSWNASQTGCERLLTARQNIGTVHSLMLKRHTKPVRSVVIPFYIHQIKHFVKSFLAVAPLAMHSDECYLFTIDLTL